MRIEERLLPQMIGGQEHAPAALVPEGEGKHPAQAANHVTAPLLITVHNHFSVSVRTKLMASRYQFGAQLLEVVDLAVEGDPDGLILIAHGLMAGGREINDGEAAVLQADPDSALR